MAGHSRPTIFMTAGWIIYTGMQSSNLERPFEKPPCRRIWRNFLRFRCSRTVVRSAPVLENHTNCTGMTVTQAACWRRFALMSFHLINRRTFFGGAAATLVGQTAAAASRPVITIEYGPPKLDIHQPSPGQALAVLF